MKLDKIAFSHVVAHCVSNGMTAGEYEVTTLDRLIDFEVPEQTSQQIYPANANVERLMALMAEGTKKVDAIREHRAITGMGLKESKEAVERYWPNIKPNSYTYSELKAKLIDLVFDINDQNVIMMFLDKL